MGSTLKTTRIHHQRQAFPILLRFGRAALVEVIIGLLSLAVLLKVNRISASEFTIGEDRYEKQETMMKNCQGN